MNVFHVSKGKPEGMMSFDDEKKFTEGNTLFVGCILSALADHLCDADTHYTDRKELWDAPNTKYSASDVGSELYIMESFNNCKMVDNCSVVEQAHEIQCIAKELELLKIILPDTFMVGCMIAKLPPNCRGFATSLKHKRYEISVENLIAFLDVEEKAQAKDTSTKGGEGQSSANMVQKNHGKGKGKHKPNKSNKTTNFKKKKANKAEMTCFTCGELRYSSKDYPDRADHRGKKANINAMAANNAQETWWLGIPMS